MRKINWGLIGFGNVVKNNINGFPFDSENSELYVFFQRNMKEGIKNKKSTISPNFILMLMIYCLMRI